MLAVVDTKPKAECEGVPLYVCVCVCVSVKAVVYLHKHSHNIKVCALTRVDFIVYLHCTSVSAAKTVWNHAASYLGCYEFAFLL